MEGGTAVKVHGSAFQTTAQAMLKVRINQRIPPFSPKNETFAVITLIIHPETVTAVLEVYI